MRNHLEQFIKYNYSATMLIEPPHDLGSWKLVAELKFYELGKCYQGFVRNGLGYILEFDL